MKITFSIFSTGKCDADIAYNVLQGQLSECTIDSVLYDNLVLEIDADGACMDDVPTEIMDAITVAIDTLAEDFGISIEIDTISAI